MTPRSNSPFNAPADHLAAKALAANLDAALATPPSISIPADFASRVAHLADAQAATARRRAAASPHVATRSYAFRFGALAALLLTIALFALAHGSFPAVGNLRFDLQMTLLLELLLLAALAPRAIFPQR